MSKGKYLPQLTLSFLALSIGFQSSLTTTAAIKERGRETIQQSVKSDDREKSGSKKREMADIYAKWLDEDVHWIITDEEREVFKKLQTDEERERLIEGFWLRRDPNPETSENEYKEEYYSRIAYANEHFSSGKPGWLTDRGRTYIQHGKPDSIDSHPSGGTYERPYWQGGGTTSTFPFEIWFYRYIEGVGSGIEIEFVDPTMSGEYRIARSPDEKDALLFVPNAGLTLAEQLGLASKGDRPFFSPGNRDRYPLMSSRLQDQPFERQRILTELERAPKVKFNDLATLIDAHLTVLPDVLPFHLRTDFIRITDDTILTVFTVLMENQDISFENVGGIHQAKVNVHGRIRPVAGRRPQIFEDVVTQQYADDVFDLGLKQESIYQRQLTLSSGNYVVDLVIRDTNSGRTGVGHLGFLVPRFSEDQLVTSSLILASKIEPLHGRIAAGPFVMGNLKLQPNVNGIFGPGQPIGVYMQIYHPGIDQTTLHPAIDVEYEVSKGGKSVMRFVEDGQNGLSRFTTQQATLARLIPVKDLEPGTYTLTVQISDHVKNQVIKADATFTIVGGP